MTKGSDHDSCGEVERVDIAHGAEMITGTHCDDTIKVAGEPEKGKNNNWLNAHAGNDMVDGSPHDDLILGGEGNDTIYANDGNDTINGMQGENEIDAEAGNDRVLIKDKSINTITLGDGEDVIAIDYIGDVKDSVINITDFTKEDALVFNFEVSESDMQDIEALKERLLGIINFENGVSHDDLQLQQLSDQSVRISYER